MKVGVFTVLLGQKPLEEVLDYLAEKGIDTVEIGTGNYPGNAHCALDELLSSEAKLKAWLKVFKDRKIAISALSCHGNGLHPDPKFAKAHTDVQRKTVQLCQRIGVKTMVTFSGCPGGGPGDKVPNWITCPWPDDFIEAVEWQWKEKVIPYWTEEAAFAAKHKVRVAFEMHPGFVVYNPKPSSSAARPAGTISARISIPAISSGRVSIPAPPSARSRAASTTFTPRTRHSTAGMLRSTASSTPSTTAMR